MKSIIVRCFALIILGLALNSGACAQTITQQYLFHKATVSLPVISQGANAYQYDRLLTKQVINLIRGRELTAKVPKNEVLALAKPFAFPSTPVFLVVIDTTKIDKSAKPFQGQDGLILGTGGKMDYAQFVFGKNGKSAIGFGTVVTNVTGDATNGILENHLQASARISGARIIATGVTGAFNFNKAGAPVNGLLAGGNLRSSGVQLCEMSMEVDITPPDL